MDDVRTRLRRLRRRIRRLERSEAASVRRWLEDTENLLHVSALVFVPLTIAGVTALANAVPSLSFLLFPPLASGAYTLFSDPEGRYASPMRFVAGMTIGAGAGWLALVAVGNGDAETVNAAAAGLAVLLTGAATWVFDVEEPAAYAVSLLLLVQGAPPGLYVASVAVASGIVAIVYEGWHAVLYERRAEVLYASTGSDDDVLVPMVDGAEPVVELAAAIARGHERGRVVLLGLVPEDGDASDDEPWPAVPVRSSGSGAGAGDGGADDYDGVGTGGTAAGSSPEGAAGGPDEADGIPGDGTPSSVDGAPSSADEAQTTDRTTGGHDEEVDSEEAVRATAERLEARAAAVEAEAGVDCEVLVARGSSPASVTLESVRETGADLVIAPFSGEDAEPFVTSLFVPDVDVAAARVSRSSWRRVLVPIRSAGDLAHLKVDLARRIAGPQGRVTVAHCIANDAERRRAEALCANVVDAYDGPFETLVARGSVESFLADHAPATDLIVMGASTDRTRVSRLLSRPTYRRVRDLPTDLLVVHAGRR